MIDKQKMKTEQLSLLNIVNGAKDLIESGASADTREEFLKNLSERTLGSESSKILENYVELVKEVLNPNTDSALRTDALESLGVVVHNKLLDLDKLEASDSPDAKAVLKVMSALKGLYGVINLVQHNLDPNDLTKLDDEAIRKVSLELLKEFSLADDAIDVARESGDLLASGGKLYAILNGKPINPLAFVIETQKFIKEGMDVISEIKGATPEIKVLVKDIVVGTKAIVSHIKERISEFDEIWDEFYDDIALINAEYNAEVLANKLEAEDGDGYHDGEFNEMVANASSLWNALGKGAGEFGEFVGDVLILGYDDDNDTDIEEELALSELVNNEGEAGKESDVEVLPTFEGVESKEVYNDIDELKDWLKENPPELIASASE